MNANILKFKIFHEIIKEIKGHFKCRINSFLDIYFYDFILLCTVKTALV